MTFTEVMDALRSFSNEQTRKTWINHGAQGEVWGVKVGDMKVIQKKIKRDHELALRLFDSGVPDAMYFGGLISEPLKMSKDELRQWAISANWYMLSEYTVAWAASESHFGHELALEWIDAREEHVASAGWTTYSCLLALKKDEALDLKEIRSLMKRIEQTIHGQPNRVRYTMNGFLISAGGYVAALTEEAKAIAGRIGKVQVDQGGTACKVPDPVAYIGKMEQAGKIGKKRKTVFC
ncbi:MAG: DNA alkylation repair protein [Chitinophagaceae bacterium]